MEEPFESPSDLQGRLAIRESENRALKQRVTDLRRRVRQLEAELSTLQREQRKASCKEDPVVIDLDSDSEPESLGSPISSIHRIPSPIAMKRDIKDEPDLSKKLVKKRSASPALAQLDDLDVKPKIEDVKPRLSKKPRLKVEVVIDSPLRQSHSRTKPRRIGSVNSSMPPQRESPARASGSSHLVDEKEYRHPADDVDMPQQQGHDDSGLMQSTLEPILQEAVPDLPVEQEQGQVQLNEAARDVSASAEPVLVVKQEEDNKTILALAAETLALLPKVEVKRGLDFDAATIQSRIDAIGRNPYPVILEPAIRAVWVSRKFMSSVYGGNPQSVQPTIKQELLDKHGLNDFFYMNLLYHPYGPRAPGQPGLFFDEEPINFIPNKEQRVFVRLQSSQWLYVGQYRLGIAEPLSQSEWAMQSDSVQKTWARELLRQDWGRRVCFRVAFRLEHDREPTRQEMEKALATKYPSDRLKWEDIRDAYTSGKERLGVKSMKCVGYDEAFQHEIAGAFATWTPPPTKIKKAPRSKEKKSQRSRKAEISEVDSEVEVVEESIYDMHVDAEDEGWAAQAESTASTYIPRGTKSRPRVG